MDNLSTELLREHYEKNRIKLKLIKRKNKKGEDIYRIAQIIQHQYSTEEKELSPIKRPPRPCPLIGGSKERFEYWELIKAYRIKPSLTFDNQEEAEIAIKKLTYLIDQDTIKKYSKMLLDIAKKFTDYCKNCDKLNKNIDELEFKSFAGQLKNKLK